MCIINALKLQKVILNHHRRVCNLTCRPKASPTHFEAIAAAISGTIYRTPPVNSNIITTSDTVILVTPPRTAAAPTIAYKPG